MVRLTSHSSDDDQRRVVGYERAPPEADQIGAMRRLDRSLGADLSVSIRVARTVESHTQNLWGYRPRILAGLGEVTESARFQTSDFCVAECGMQSDIGQQMEGGWKVRCQRPDRHA